MATSEDSNLKVMVILPNCIDSFLCPRIEDSWAKVPVLQVKNNLEKESWYVMMVTYSFQVETKPSIKSVYDCCTRSVINPLQPMGGQV